MGIRALLRGINTAFRARTGVPIVLPLLMAVTFMLLLFKLDPFGLGDASHHRSEQATLRIMAPSYKSSGLVTVVYLDDEYITNRQSGWPLRYGEQGRLMRALLAAKPAVLLVDLVYPHQHAKGIDGQGPSDDISQLLAPILKPNGTPIVFTGMALPPELVSSKPAFEFCSPQFSPGVDDLLDPKSMLPDLRTRLTAAKPNEPGSQVQLGYVRWSGCADRYPFLLGGNPNTVTPVFAAYRAYCDRYPTQARCDLSPPRTRAADYLHPMIVRSGAFPPSTQAFAFDESVCQRPGKTVRGEVGFWRRAWATLQQLALSVFKDLRTDPNKQLALPCPAVTVVPMSLLETATANEWRELLTDKAVVLGADLSGFPDIVTTAVHGQVPGVVWHAMALDNLMSMGSDYLAERHEETTATVKALLVLLLAYALPFLFAFVEHRHLKKSMAVVSLGMWLALTAVHLSAGHIQNALIALGIGIALDLTKPTASAGYFAAMLLAALASVVSLWQGWSAGNWFGLVILAIAFAATLKPYYKGSERKPFPDKLSIVGSILNLNKKGIADEHD